MRTEITLNERLYYSQKKNPTPCKYGCGKKLVFLKTIGGQTLACESQIFKFENHHKVSVMMKDGMTSSQGEREGWLVHDCPRRRAEPIKTEDDEIPPPELEPLSNNSGLNFLQG